MGFKRTSEGRVFFQESNDSNLDQPAASQQTQVQILALLKSLNDRLQSTQMERKQMREELDAYRSLVEDLENKSDRSERAYMDLEQKLARSSSKGGVEDESAKTEQLAEDLLKEMSETRKLMYEIEHKAERADKNAASLKNQVSQSYKISEELAKKQIDLTTKVETSLEQQGKLTRKIDKAVEDRARFMRKIERIEETVIQTRDSLNAKAMVLLTDQDVVGEGEEEPTLLESLRSDKPMAAPKMATAKPSVPPWWRQSFAAQAAGIIPLVVVALLAGWFISQMQKPQAPDLESFKPNTTNSGQTAAVQKIEPDWTVSTDTTAFSENAVEPLTQQSEYPVEASSSAYRADDIGTLDLNDEDQLVALLEENPDRLAAELNAIEPAVVDPTPVKKVAATEAPPKPTPVKKAAAPKKPVKKAKAVKPDASLPAAVKEIETQAFDGVAEAQHDLAAIYTAGHGNVKQNYSRAAYWFEQAAGQGIANAAYNLGVLNHQGLGMEPDVGAAIYWYSEAAKMDHPEAQYNLGIAYIEGIGVAYDPKAAAKYFENAADQGVLEAAYNLGLIYENGLLGKPEPDKALKWYKTAADRGSPEAKAALEQLAKALGIELGQVEQIAEGVKLASSKPKAVPAVPEPVVEKAPEPAPAPTAVVEEIETVQEDFSEEFQEEFQGTPEPVYESAEDKGIQEQIVLAQIQEYLISVGLFPGPADGIDGPLTQDAIRSYQAVSNMHQTGRSSTELLSHMLANTDFGSEGITDLGSRAE